MSFALCQNKFGTGHPVPCENFRHRVYLVPCENLRYRARPVPFPSSRDLVQGEFLNLIFYNIPMVLADVDIKREIDEGKIVVKPLPDFDVALSACSLDLRLGYEFKIFEHMHIPYYDPLKHNEENVKMKEIKLKKGEMFILQPNEFALASTLEWVELPDYLVGRLEGRSSIGRLGIVVHSTASLIHPGWKGKIVLELGNHSRMPVALYPGMRICSVSFEKLTQPAKRPYYKQKGAKYVGQAGVISSKIIKDVQDK